MLDPRLWNAHSSRDSTNGFLANFIEQDEDGDRCWRFNKGQPDVTICSICVPRAGDDSSL